MTCTANNNPLGAKRDLDLNIEVLVQMHLNHNISLLLHIGICKPTKSVMGNKI